MKIQLLKGSFNPKDLEKIVTELIYVKIKFHEEKIQEDDNEETIKMRENRIIKLQNELKEVRNLLTKNLNYINAEAELILSDK
jgi:hypothetical protein